MGKNVQKGFEEMECKGQGGGVINQSIHQHTPTTQVAQLDGSLDSAVRTLSIHLVETNHQLLMFQSLLFFWWLFSILPNLSFQSTSFVLSSAPTERTKVTEQSEGNLSIFSPKDDQLCFFLK